MHICLPKHDFCSVKKTRKYLIDIWFKELNNQSTWFLLKHHKGVYKTFGLINLANIWLIRVLKTIFATLDKQCPVSGFENFLANFLPLKPKANSSWKDILMQLSFSTLFFGFLQTSLIPKWLFPWHHGRGHYMAKPRYNDFCHGI